MGMRPKRTRRLSLVSRLYAAGVIVVLACALVAWGAARLVAGPREVGRISRYFAAGIAADPSPAEAVARAAQALDADVALFDADGHTIAEAGDPIAAPDDTIPVDVRRERPSGELEVGASGGRSVVIRYHGRTTGWLPLLAGLGSVLLVVGVAAWLASRWLMRPLGRLGATARAIAAGNLASRTGIVSNDEIGDAAEAFDGMAERVENLLRSQRELLASVSHELRTPLARIRVALDIASESADSDPMRTDLAGVEEDIGELELLVSDLLEMARLDHERSGGELPLRREPASLAEVVERARTRFGERHPGRVVTLTIDARKDAELDPRLLRRAIENVLDNAHKYSDPESAIRIEVASDGDRSYVLIHDEGIGIAKADLARVFTPFFRADRAEVRASSGLGLGLALARRIVEAHGGAITLDSELGQGTTVRITV